MDRNQILQHIRNRLNAITNKRYTRDDQAYAYQLGFLQSILVEEMLRDSHVWSRFNRAADRALTRRPGNGPAAK